jgi:hypothetical protein
MYIDGLTIAAIIVFVIALVMFVKGCILHECGSAYETISDLEDRTGHTKA